MITIIESKGFLPGGYAFIDPRVPDKVWKDTKTNLESRIAQIIDFRKSNPEIFDEKKEPDLFNPNMVKQEIAEFNYHRLGKRSPHFNVTTNPPAKSRHVCCGVDMVPRYCPSCPGNKLLGYRCPRCGRFEK